MSKEQANEFLKKLYTDKATAEKFQEAFRALVVKAGQDAGFKFTADDLKAALAEAKTEELSEDALKGVAGGILPSTSRLRAPRARLQADMAMMAAQSDRVPWFVRDCRPV